MTACRWNLLLTVSLLLLGGCTRSNQPPLPVFPKIDFEAAAKAAMEMYDTNHDGRIDADEAKKSPAMVKLLESADANGDGSLTADEIAKRIERWSKDTFPVMTLTFNVTLDGQPVDQAAIAVEPEKFLSPPLEAVSMTTDAAGLATPPATIPPYRGILFGVYRVRISKKDAAGQEQIPARYNAESELGLECAYDLKNVREVGYFRLQSK